MKILIIGSDYNWSIERIYKRELIKMGHQVLHLPVQNWYYNYYFKSTFNKILIRLGLFRPESIIQNILLSEINGLFFDLIWVFKGMEIAPETIRCIKKQTSRLINFNPDNPFVFSGKGSGNKNVTHSIPLYDEHFTYDYEIKTRIEKEYGLKCSLVPFCFDTDINEIDELGSLEENKIVCFVGNPDPYRARILREFLDSGLELHIYGHDWQKYLRHPNLEIFNAVYGNEYYVTLRRYRVQLNIMRLHNLNSHNMRSVEIAGCGGIMLAPRTDDHVKFFEEGQEAFFYSDINELISKANEILILNDELSAAVRLRARLKVCNEFSYSSLTSIFLKE